MWRRTSSAIAERTEQENHARFVPLAENTGKDVETIEVNPIIFRKLTREDWLHIVDVCDKSLEKYYLRLKK